MGWVATAVTIGVWGELNDNANHCQMGYPDPEPIRLSASHPSVTGGRPPPLGYTIRPYATPIRP